ncbi:cytochrome c oxidase subunit II [Ferruginibacter albus]|uniref:cytochrome c oxidase subunit II n=1 Tax=Ferruginibacter albus TaxID=2875540 RepID=UPI001CC3B920|nr:cytochrome c oxidase subunit II [Ferruginibacter albus]UAY52173.1 cytochrome c oxidase subunit II [Ferruginibacter albus]
MTGILLVAIIVMIFVIIFQISKASEYVSVLKGEETARKQNNKINAFLMITFLILGLIGVWVCNDFYYGKTLFVQGSASEQGKKIDLMLYITIGVTGVVFVITQVLLFWFAFKYQEKDNRKAFYFPHNNKLELLWTTVPAIFLTVLVVFGLKYWFKMTGPAPDNAVEVEVTGHQFGWEFRYPGPDGILGHKDYKLTQGANSLGIDFSDKASLDDIHVGGTMHIPVGKPIKLVINSQDVIHDVGLSHFRMKMDAVPGIPTTLWFTPLYTTEQMKKRTGNPNFAYEISCDQMCGKGHFSMRGVIIVESEEEYKKWLAQQTPEYYTVYPEKKPPVPAAPADSTEKGKTAMLSATK